jgi:phosphate ABC transporter permease protein PstC
VAAAADTRTAAERRWSDRRAERVLGGLSVLVLLVIAGMVLFVFANAWPSFRENGILGWFSSGDIPDQQLKAIQESPSDPAQYRYDFNAWPLLWGTLLTTGFAVACGLVLAVLSAVFLVEFAPPQVRRVLDPVVRLLAAVPSVIYGLIGLLALAPFVTKELISEDRQSSVIYVVQLTGTNWLLAAIILTMMITPIMVAIISDALRVVPRSWTEGSLALGVNRWRTMLKIAVRTARPAIIAAVTLATARALGEAIMLSMVSGAFSFAPNPIDGITFLFEPTRPLAATIVANAEALSVPPLSDTVYAMAAVLLFSAAVLSFGSWAAKQPMKKYAGRV